MAGPPAGVLLAMLCRATEPLVLTRRLLRALLTVSCLSALAAAGSVPNDEAARRCATVMRAQLVKAYPPDGCWRQEDFALAAYWLNERTAEADQALLDEREKEFPAALAAHAFHWHAYLLERIYFLFGRDSGYFPGRMSAAAEAALLDMLWQWAGPQCRLEMTLPERDEWVWGSENHHAQAWVGFWGAAQIFAQNTAYKDRRYADNSTPAQMAAAFDAYFKRFARERAGKGLLVECNSAYNKYTLGGWYNLADFATDPVLRQRFAMLLDLFWADWACEQIDGVRGGSRHRCYPGDNSTGGSSMDGAAWFHFGLGPARSQHPSHMCAATTLWRPSPLVVDVALDVDGRGVYESRSRRPGLAQPPTPGVPPANYVSDPAHPFYSPQGVYRLCPDGGGLLRYSFCTPDFVMGTSMVEARPQQDWTNISSQNRWEGVVFAGHPTARLFVQPLRPERGSVYNANWSVQKRGTLIVQRLKTSNAKGQRVWFDASLRRSERDGWVFAEAPRAFAGVRVLRGGTVWEPDSAAQHHEGKGPTDRGEWLKCVAEFSPVIIEVARRTDFASLDAFAAAVIALPLQDADPVLSYTGIAGDRFTFSTDYSQPPQINGVPVNYTPAKVFDSPFLQSDWDSGVVTLRKGDRQQVLNFNADTPSPPPGVGQPWVPTDVDWQHPVYTTPFDTPDALSGWRLEGGRSMQIEDGKLVLESEPGGEKPAAGDNHLVCWLAQEMPADFLLEFSVRPQDRKRGLNIVFFNARGVGGESIFAPSLQPRDGLFKQYHSGDLRNYHISYWASDRGTANVRKNPGFHLVASGNDLVANAPAEAFQTIRLYKRGGTIRLLVDGVVAVAFDDDGVTYGPVWTHSGWIGLRQMAHTVRCEYDDLRVFPCMP